MGRKPEEPEKDEFIVLFTALSMILLAFFIMLNSMAVMDDSRSRAALNSLLGTFGMMPGYASIDTGALQGEPPRLTPRQRIKRLTELLERIDAIGQPGMDIKVREDGRPVIEFDTGVLFRVGGQMIAPEHYPLLDSIAQTIVDSKYPVFIEGHTDGRPMKGGRTNWYLSAARAASVHRYLESTTRIAPGQISSIGFGPSRPHPEATGPDDPRHRRVEVVFEITKDLKALRKQVKDIALTPRGPAPSEPPAPKDTQAKESP